MKSLLPIVLLLGTLMASNGQRKILPDHKILNDYDLALPFSYVELDSLPKTFSWNNVNGTNFLTRSLNQHLPQVSVS
ncbi:peptidase C1A, papain C-terminal [Chaetoceros tenuissimus]|uniref:Peptidase C1A, papain C-terminal n=1 Tax=Chaetoceros tenuissimus TaxID=426638 RepID=A0AAD3D6C1_9STRA|nr:peptidase C1A, papain C-terminal [Chaetoceros tenuissimus]